jgi:hypothetical protein
MAKKIFFSVIVLTVCFRGARAASEAMYLKGPEIPLAAGSEFTVRILVDSDVPINAYSAELSYPARNLSVLGFDESRSLVSIWQEQPVAAAGVVKFGGGSLAPFQGKGGELLAVRFRVDSGSAGVSLNLADAAFYLADGKGTKAIPSENNLALALAPRGVSSTLVIEPTLQDTTPPEIRSLAFLADPFDASQKILSFEVYDPGSGIKEVEARSRTWFWWSDWHKLGSSVALQNDVWAVDFKAVDNQNNVSERVIYDWRAGSEVLGTSTAAAVFAAFIVWRIVRRRRIVVKKNKHEA